MNTTTITLNYSIGDTVWFMHENQAKSSKVMNWKAEGNNGGPVIITYWLQVSFYNNGFEEKKLFPSKDALLKSL